MPFDPVTTVPRKRIAKRATYAPRRDWLDRLMNEPAPKPAAESQLVRDLRGALCLLLAHGWTAGTFARTDKGIECSVADREAAMFCAGGAVYRAVIGLRDRVHDSDLDDPASLEAMRINTAFAHLTRYTGGLTLPAFNDLNGAARVIALFERAIADVLA